jgi:hypothetical protein
MLLIQVLPEKYIFCVTNVIVISYIVTDIPREQIPYKFNEISVINY